MKLAIFGSSPIALEATLRFHLHGAALTWFNFAEPELEKLYQAVELKWEEVTSDLGWQLLGQQKKSGHLESWNEWKEFYSVPLTELFKQTQRIRPYEVLTATKRHLAKDEDIPDKTRFYDLFRVIYQLNPSEFIQEQRESNPDTYKRLTEEFVQSLQSTIEMYEDFDLILDLRVTSQTGSASSTGRALGETRIAKEHISYGLEALEWSDKISPGPANRELALIGSGELAAQVLMKLEDWLKEPRSQLFIVSSEASPFDGYLKEAKPAAASKLRSLIENMEQEFQDEVNNFTKKLREWQELDDFVRVKYPRPAEPIPRLNFFSGHNVSAVDQLIDRNRIFLSLEKPDFRKGLRHPENNHLELKTVGADHVLVTTELKKTSLKEHLRHNEKGFFDLEPTGPSLKGYWYSDLEKLKGIEDEIFKLFSPADTH